MEILKLKKNFHQHKEPISIKNIDIDKIKVSNKLCFGKNNDLNISLVTNMLKKLALFAYFSQS